MTTLLDQIRSKVTVDVDSMDPDVAARHTLPGATFSDMTSNQAIAYSEAVRPERADLVKSACTQIRSTEGQLDIDSQASNAADLLVCTSMYMSRSGILRNALRPRTHCRPSS